MTAERQSGNWEQGSATPTTQTQIHEGGVGFQHTVFVTRSLKLCLDLPLLINLLHDTVNTNSTLSVTVSN